MERLNIGGFTELAVAYIPKSERWTDVKDWTLVSDNLLGSVSLDKINKVAVFKSTIVNLNPNILPMIMDATVEKNDNSIVAKLFSRDCDIERVVRIKTKCTMDGTDAPIIYFNCGQVEVSAPYGGLDESSLVMMDLEIKACKSGNPMIPCIEIATSIK